MKLTTILFDLDGTLLPMVQEEFVKEYFRLLVKKAAPLGYEPEKLIDTLWKGCLLYTSPSPRDRG